MKNSNKLCKTCLRQLVCGSSGKNALFHLIPHLFRSLSTYLCVLGICKIVTNPYINRRHVSQLSLTFVWDANSFNYLECPIIHLLSQDEEPIPRSHSVFYGNHLSPYTTTTITQPKCVRNSHHQPRNHPKRNEWRTEEKVVVSLFRSGGGESGVKMAIHIHQTNNSSHFHPSKFLSQPQSLPQLDRVQFSFLLNFLQSQPVNKVRKKESGATEGYYKYKTNAFKKIVATLKFQCSNVLYNRYFILSV